MLPGLRRQERGFSLLELLIVLILLGVLATVAAPAMGRFLDNLEFRKQTAKVMATLRYARLMAITRGKTVRMSLGDDELSLLLEGAVTEVRPFDAGEDAAIALDPEVIVFSPQGYATPGSVNIRVGDREQLVLIDPLSGLPLLPNDEDE